MRYPVLWSFSCIVLSFFGNLQSDIRCFFLSTEAEVKIAGFCWCCFGVMATNSSAGHACPSPMKSVSNGIFQGDNPLHFALPLAILQICLVLVVTRGLAYLFRPLRQPRVIAEIVVCSSFLCHVNLVLSPAIVVFYSHCNIIQSPQLWRRSQVLEYFSL